MKPLLDKIYEAAVSSLEARLADATANFRLQTNDLEAQVEGCGSAKGWGDTAPFDYDQFLVRWDREGGNVGQADVSEYIDRTNGFFRIQAPLPARYSLIVEGCNTGIGGSTCEEGWTVPVDVEYRLPLLPAYAGCPPEAMPFGLIGERWAQMGGAEGPLGCPQAREHPVAVRPGATQSFRSGEVSFSPQQGEQMLLVVHLAGNVSNGVED